MAKDAFLPSSLSQLQDFSWPQNVSPTRLVSQGSQCSNLGSRPSCGAASLGRPNLASPWG